MGVFTFNYSPQRLDLFAVAVLKNPHRASALLLRNHAPVRKGRKVVFDSNKERGFCPLVFPQKCGKNENISASSLHP